MKTTDLLLLRHGEPILTKALLGSTDSPLSEMGWKQLQSSFEQLAGKVNSCHQDKAIDQIISSPLSRCLAFAQSISSKLNIPLSVLDDWRECDFGEWDGVSYQALQQNYPEQLAQFFSRPAECPPPKGEILSDFCQRVENALHSLHSQCSGQRVLILTHAGVIRTLVAWCLKIDYSSGLQFHRFAIDYASLTHLSLYQDETLFPQLVSLNAVPQVSLQESLR